MQMRVEAPPHLHCGRSTARIMWTTVLSLLPAGAWGIWVFGLRALLVVVVAVAASVIGELIVGLFRRQLSIWDGSAVLSGLLIGYLMGPGVALYIPAAASLFAMIVVKGSFGGLGANWMNPAAAGQVFAFVSWGAGVASWTPVRFPPYAPGAALSPLGFLAARGASHAGAASDQPFAILSAGHYPTTTMASTTVDWLSSVLGVRLDPHVVDLIVGSHVGWIGAVSVPLLCAGGIYLIAAGHIEWRIPVTFGAGFAIFVWLFAGLGSGGTFHAGAPLFNLLTGGFLLAAFYLASDPVTSPLTRGGMIGYGIGLALLAALIRVYGESEEAAVFAVIVMNMAVPLINRIAEGRRRAIRR